MYIQIKKKYYKNTAEKGQGSEADMASMKRVKEESVKDLGILLILSNSAIHVN